MFIPMGWVLDLDNCTRIREKRVGFESIQFNHFSQGEWRIKKCIYFLSSHLKADT